MHIDIMVEEPSAKAAMEVLVPHLVAGRATFKVTNFQSKQEMLRRLPDRLKGYRRRMPHEELCLLVLIDEDREDCKLLKAKLEEMAADAGLVTKSQAGPAARFHVVNRIVVEELEAWFFGDVEALHVAYPKVPASLGNRAAYRDPDAIKGGTWEALHRVLRKAGYYSNFLPKIEVARRVSAHMDPSRNTSRSFRTFCAAVEAILA